jgi:GH15 family glucan-1,4-alpha-glucosidase
VSPDPRGAASATADDTEGPPLADYGFLSDCSSAALVSTGGSVDWWCLPRFDSPSVFGRLLDPAAGHWLLAPTGEYAAERDYVEDALVLRTVLRTESGAVAITDALSLQPGARGHDIGLGSPHALLRLVEGLEGTVDLQTIVAPRFEYGLTVPRWSEARGSWSAHVGPVALRLTASVDLHAEDGDLRGGFRVGARERVGLCLAFTPPYEDGAGMDVEPADAIEDTVAGWRSWSELHRGYQGRHVAQVRRSALVLQGLTYQRTGAVVAAATTSLPEELGGTLNWDYRFAWLRDVSLTLQALWVAACPHEADRFFDWLTAAVGHVGGAPLQIMYDVEGERDLTEHTLDHLAGYRGSRPVRVGNDAWKQRQLDVLGEILFAAHLLREHVTPFGEATRDLLVTLADQAARDWQQPDAGMWESRDEARQYTSSKVMCWVALDRAIALAGDLGDRARPDSWKRARQEIRETVLEQAWSESAGAYAGALGSDSLDASVLMMPLVGFLPADDPRMLATIEAVRDRLGDGRLVRRWDGDTAGFVICSFWLIECLALAGKVEEAETWFEHLLEHGSDLGLFAEEIDPKTREQLGNYPQAFSHVGLVNAAWRLTQCTSGQDLDDVQ